MPVSIVDLQEDRRTVYIEKYKLNVTYRPNQLTPARELAILKAAGHVTDDDDDDDDDVYDDMVTVAEKNIHRQMSSMVELVEAWDLTGPLAVGPDGENLFVPTEQNEFAADWVEAQGGKLLVQHNLPIPIQPECLKLLGSFFLNEVLRFINEDMRPPKRRRRS